MLARLKKILLQQYIGAIVTAFVAAQGVASLVSLVMMPITYYFLIAGRPARGFLGQQEPPRMFDWNGLIVAIATICLQFGAAAILIRWLYYGQAAEAEPSEPATGA